ncbi:S53 family peptidase [Amycolatopsis jiangsuensis]|uniref:Kumamolisin n=1 Tax=Amycolatopsis jiangsuensis TaxID=1181879 RepID=A0A840J3H4_9PSEU|nr:S53 family peptidase [Amycolatopsis jiangsuensis]MBB4687958.1 kumamolisin [Amycolatopsis jiangsuensis]
MRMRKLVAAAVPLPALLCLSLTGVANADPLISLSGNDAPLVASARSGDVDGARQITAALSLKLHNQQALRQFLADVQNPASPNYHHFLTPQQFTTAFGPTQAEADQAVEFLKDNGATGITVSGNRQAVTFSGTAAQLESAFHTGIGNYLDTVTGRTFFANDSAPALPKSVASVVDSVVGLDNHAVQQHSTTEQAPHAAKAVTPDILKKAYGTGDLSATGAGVSVGFVEFDGYDKSDITAYDSKYGLKGGSVTTVPVNGTSYDDSPGQGETEVDLDVEVVHAVAAAADSYVYEAENSSAGELAMYQQIASDKKVSVVSISWGACEAAEGASAANSVDKAIATGTAEGISYFAAAGDDGTTDCARQNGSKDKAVDFPASSPNVSGVGGTQLSVDSSNGYDGEVAWNDGASGGAGGGGTSTIFDAPSWQGKQSTTKREVPDVSADAAQGSAYTIVSGGQTGNVWGTSGAAPLWAGFTVLQNEVSGGPLGNLNPKFYDIGNGAQYGSGFNDVTEGNNDFNGTTGFSAGTGYDQVTGWGSFKGAGLSGLLGS